MTVIRANTYSWFSLTVFTSVLERLFSQWLKEYVLVILLKRWLSIFALEQQEVENKKENFLKYQII